MKNFRLKHFAVMLLIGDGAMALVRPEHDAQAWKVGPRWWQAGMTGLRDRPLLTRLIGVAEIAAGVAWALEAERPVSRLLPVAIAGEVKDALIA
jgi:hypothetical protein